MLRDNKEFARVSESLHDRYDGMPVPPDLARRVDSILRADNLPSWTPLPPNLGQIDNGLTRPGRRRIAIFASAAAVATLLGIGVFLIQGRVGESQIAQQPASGVGVSKVAACSTPTSSFPHFYIYNRYGDTAGAYAGTVQVGKAKVPPSSIYVSNGPIGSGYLCLSNTPAAGKTNPVHAVLSARTAPIAYLGLIDGDQPWGAVGPNVTTLAMSVKGQPDDVYTVNSTDDHLLRPLGDGWHAFNSWSGFSGTGPVTITVTAYAGTQVVDTLSVTTGVSQSSQSSPLPQPTS